MRFLFLAALAFGTIGSAPLNAQRQSQRDVSALAPGARVRLQTTAGSRASGTLAVYRPDSVFILSDSGGHLVGIPTADMKHMWVGPGKNKTGRTVFYAISGIFAGGAAGYLLHRKQEPTYHNEMWDTYFFGPIPVKVCDSHCNEPGAANSILTGGALGIATGILLGQLWDGPWHSIRFR